jgi:hypothetical protein
MISLSDESGAGDTCFPKTLDVILAELSQTRQTSPHDARAPDTDQTHLSKLIL